MTVDVLSEDVTSLSEHVLEDTTRSVSHHSSHV